MEKEFRLHLRLTEKDRDLCRWRHSVKNKMLTYYICQILTAEMRGEIAFLHGFKGMSANDEPCDIFYACEGSGYYRIYCRYAGEQTERNY